MHTITSPRQTKSFWRLVLVLAICLPTLPASLFLGSGSARAASSTLYTITDLGTLGGTYSWAYGINNSGQVVGYAANAAGNARAFLWQNGAMSDLGSLGSPQDTEAYAINNLGQVTGFSYTATGSRHAFLWQNGSMADLGVLPGAGESFGWAIGDSTQVAGQSGGSSFLWQNNTMSNPVPYGKDAHGINKLGHMVGYYYLPTLGPFGHAYLWANGTVTDLGTLGGDFSEAYAVNDSDAVVGDARSPTVSNEAFLWQNGTMTGLGSLPSSAGYSYAYGINNANPVQVVGYSSASNGNDAFVWQNGVMTDLNSVLVNGTGWQLADARAINDQGQIVGNGYINGQPHGYLLTPTAPTPVVYLHPGAMDFGQHDLGTTTGPYDVVVANHGNADLTIGSIAITGANAGDFAQTNNCGSVVPAGSACVVYATFTPTGYGARSASLVITDNAGDSPQIEPLSGFGGTSAVALSPVSVSFSNQNTGTMSTVQTVTLTDTGAADLTIYSISVSGANASDFAQTNTCAHPLAHGTSCTISVTFAPTATGARTASLNVWDGDTNVTSSVPLSGTGTAPAATLSPAAVSFGNQNTGTTSPAQTVTFTNSGTGPLTINNISITGTNQGDFTQTNSCGSTLAAGASCSINVTFTPVLTGSRTATLTVTENAAGSPHTVPLSGNGTAPSVSLNPTSLSFGNQWYNTTSAPQTVTITNTGTGPLTFASAPFSIAGGNSSDFAQSGTTCGTTLAAGTSCTVSITFTPLGIGSRSSTLYIRDDASNSSQQVVLSGFGLSADLGLTMTPSSTSVKSGAALTYTIAATNIGPGNATGVTVTDPLPAGETFNSATTGCTVSSSRVTCALGSMAAGATSTVSITVKVKTSSTSITNTATVSASTYDPNTANNSASTAVSVR